MDIFRLRDQLIQDYASYASSFIQINDPRIYETVFGSLDEGLFWPNPLIQLNPTFESGGTVDELVDEGLLHPECQSIFRSNKDKQVGKPFRFHRHQREAIEIARQGHNYILTTGTGSGKSLSYIVPIVDHVLRRGSGKGIQAIIVYPMNALANSQAGELEKFVIKGYEDGEEPVTFARYTGQENDEERQRIITSPPDILLTNYVMLELIMTRPRERQLIAQAEGLRFFVLDELHTYRGRQGADVALLVRRVRNRLETNEQELIFVGTSATLASEGTYAEQRDQVAEVGTRLFGSTVNPDHIVGETLQRSTIPYANQADFITDLKDALAQGEELSPPIDYEAFVSHPLSNWMEEAFGLREVDGRLVRQQPRTIQGEAGAAQDLSQLTNVDEDTCAKIIQRWLLGGYASEPSPETGFRPFAFRLHQFISPGDTVYSTIEAEDVRYNTLQGQQFVPGDRNRVLFPLCFCRECGQEYYTVRLHQDEDEYPRFVESRDFSDRFGDEESEIGYLYLSEDRPWPHEADEIIDRLPDDWLEERKGELRIRSHRRKKLPLPLHLAPDGQVDSEGTECVFIPKPFMFCLHCGVAYSARQGEFGKLATLSSEGRSSATTLLSLSAIRSLKISELDQHAQKLLSFTDNRQDAALQAGHFNDFIEVSLLRGAIYRAVHLAGDEGLSHEIVAEKVFDALDLPLRLYASDPTVRFQALQETQRALRQVLGYRIYRDLRRGWRIALPNLEQSGLLDIDYGSLEDVCTAEDIWQDFHPALATATPRTRERIAKVLLDYMRRELTIKVDYLDSNYQERIKQLSSQRLKEPWAIDEDETMEYASVLFPRSSTGDDGHGNNTYLSARSGFGIYLRRPNTFEEYDATRYGKLGLDETTTIIRQLLEGLRIAGLVEVVQEPKSEGDVPGYQLVALSMRWYAGDGLHTFHDPIRVPNPPEDGGKPNPFFVDFYREVADSLVGLEAKEHTAQVPYQKREEREQRFRSGELPILYCSPTMELGVDIAELNVVNMRNVPPTPANYAQRSGRAGRSGQPALVFTYCSSGSPHDQYFFKRPERMVAGAVSPPRLDLTNEDLLRAHIHAIWLSETGIDLRDTLKEILDMNGEPPSLELLPEIRQQAESDSAKRRALRRARNILESIHELADADRLIDLTIQNVVRAFDDTCARWRGLYLAALQQADIQGKIIRDATRPVHDKRQADRLRRDAESQLRLLTQIDSVSQSDFYSYRYFATEGFLPGYSFPRLPISAFIPGRRVRQRDEFLSRPRFLAISEFGPRGIIYHEGSRYIINQVIMPVTTQEDEPLTTQIKQCRNCGYIHPVKASQNPDNCERCNYPLDIALHALLKMENVVTRRRDRINADEEERLRMGYDIRTGVRFSQRDGQFDVRTAIVRHNDEPILKLTYAQTAIIWRINMGWARRKNKNQHGFVLDVERGYWARNEAVEEEPTDPLSERTKRVIPYVEDSRNCLLFEPMVTYEPEEMASLQAALKRAIEALFQLEDNELAAEPLPDRDERRSILFYEAAEGGAGVLRQIVETPDTLAQVAAEALQICHFDPDSGDDLRRAPRAKEDCEAACYDCLLSYANQREHAILDRKLAKPILTALRSADVVASPTGSSRDSHFDYLLKLCESELEQEWLHFLDEYGLRLPSKAQSYMNECETRPDFLYDGNGVYAAIYVDGPQHDYPYRQMRDGHQKECMEDYGYRVLRFGYLDDWEGIIRANGHIFGELR